jgi:hypothetical protein
VVVLQAMFVPVQFTPPQQGCPAPPQAVQIWLEILQAMLTPVQLFPGQQGMPDVPHE